MKRVLFAVVFLGIVGIAFLAGGWYGKEQGSSPSPPAERQVLYYIDPMNPGFRSEEPGVAPCGMPLEPVYAEAGSHAGTGMDEASYSPGTVKVSPARQQLIGVEVDSVEPEPMTYNLRLYGKIVPDETKIYRVNASTNSWVRSLSDDTTGSIVRKDQILAEVLAPAFYNSQVTYLIALDNIDRIQRQLGGQVRHQQTDLADNQIRVAVQSLQNLGITDAQVEELANTREARPYLEVRSPTDGVVLSRSLTLYQWFKAGEEFYSVADIGRVWVYADVYEDEARHLRPGMEVKVQHVQMGKSFSAKVSRVLPLFDSVAKTLKVRLDVDNPRYELRPDMFVDVEIPITMPPSLHVPADAVIDTGTVQLVYVDMGDGTFEPRRVETGWRLGRRIEITGGLMPGEKVIVSGNFLIDSESRMKTAAAGIQGPMSKDPVCGMYVDEGKGKRSGRIAPYDGKTYFFCSDHCREAFEKDPEKYARKAGLSGTAETRNAGSETKPGWLEMLGAGDTGKAGGAESAIGSPATFPGVVDWNGPEQEGDNATPIDWGGWGKFPGAKYLGQGKAPEMISDQESDNPAEANAAPREDEGDSIVATPMSHEHHSEMKDEMREQPASDDPAPHAN